MPPSKLVVLVAALAASVLSLTACSSSSESFIAAQLDAPAADKPGDPGDATPTVVDAADLPDGGAAPTPGVVRCGSGTCAVSTSTCCQESDVDAGGTRCLLGTQVTCPAQTGAVHCQAAADCKTGEICCDVGGYGNTQCATSCANFQMCRTNSECKNGQPCVVQQCYLRVVEACGKQSFCQ